MHDLDPAAYIYIKIQFYCTIITLVKSINVRLIYLFGQCGVVCYYKDVFVWYNINMKYVLSVCLQEKY